MQQECKARNTSPGLVAAIATAALWAALCSAPSFAGAWTRDKGDGLLILGLSLHELLPAQGYDAFDRLKAEVSVYGEYGFTDRLTLVGRAAWQSMQITTLQTEQVGYPVEVKRTDPLFADPDADFDGDGITNQFDPPPPAFEQRTKTRSFFAAPETGVGGLQAGVRYRLMDRGRFVLSLQAVAGLPGDGENLNNLRFGEGGGSADVRVLAGRSFGRSTFFDLSAGVRLAPDDQADEVRLDMTAGTHVGRGVRVMAQTYSVWSIADRPEAARSYSGHRAQLSVLWPLDSRRRAQLSVLTTLGRDNMSRETALIASVWRSF